MADQGKKNSAGSCGRPLSTGPGHGWQQNLLLLGILVLVMLVYFYWQAAQAKKEYIRHAADHNRLLVGMISSSLSNAMSSQEAIEKTIHAFIAGSAGFADYLDSVEPFSAEELASFALEANLTGIKIIRFNGDETEGPPEWAPVVDPQASAGTLLHFPDSRLYLIVRSRSYEPGWILVGFDSSMIDRLMEDIGLDRLLGDMQSLPLIKYVRLEKDSSLPVVGEKMTVDFVRAGHDHVAEISTNFHDGRLVLGLDANEYVSHLSQLWRDFIAVSILLVSLGLFFSWLLYRYQSAFLNRVKEFERQMARRREEAALGRAVATISHEVKNPLNAIGMGLQRLQLEMDNIPAEHKKLLHSMRLAVNRTSHIISDLKQYTQPISPHYQKIMPRELIEDVVAMYRRKCLEQNITITYDNRFKGSIEGDESLLGQVVENLLKNSIEAQPGGGYIKIVITGRDGMFTLAIENAGLTMSASEVGNMVEPYFTSKTSGCGLGLAVSKGIIEAHGGRINIEAVDEVILRVTVELPVKNPF